MFTLRSPAFAHEAAIPPRHTCDGPDVSPPLAWSGAPAGTKSFALLVDDPDAPDPAAPKRVWLHWLRYDIAPDVTGLPEGAGNRPPHAPAHEALTDSNESGWGGPCPPVGRHRYFFHLYALDCTLPDLGPRARRRDFERAIEGHVLATAELMGTYARG